MRIGTLLLVAAAATTLCAAWFWGEAAPGSAQGEPGIYGLDVTGPTGAIFAGQVWVEEPTALGALLAAAEAGDFAVETVTYPGFAPCATYVRSIAGHEAEGARGWTYEIGRDGRRVHPSVGACAYALVPGDVVHWSWDEA